MALVALVLSGIHTDSVHPFHTVIPFDQALQGLLSREISAEKNNQDFPKDYFMIPAGFMRWVRPFFSVAWRNKQPFLHDQIVHPLWLERLFVKQI